MALINKELVELSVLDGPKINVTSKGLTALQAMLMEEAAEVLNSSNRAEELDGLLDLLGVVIKMLSYHDHDERMAGVEGYDRAQINKGRKIRNHNAVIRSLMDDDANFNLPEAQEVESEQMKTLRSRLNEKTIQRVERALERLRQNATV